MNWYYKREIFQKSLSLTFGIFLKGFGALLGALFYLLSRQNLGDVLFADLALDLSYIMLLGTIFKFGADQYLLKSEYIEQDLLKSNALFICLFFVSFLALWTFLGFNNAARISICAAFKYYLDMAKQIWMIIAMIIIKWLF